MRRILVVSVLLIALMVAGGGGFALAQEKKGETPIDLFITTQVWAPFQPGYTFKHEDTSFQRTGPQLGGQVALRYGDFTLGVSGLLLEERYTDVDRARGCCFGSEETTEAVRRDIDYSIGYTFRDVVPDLLDVSSTLTLYTFHADYDQEFTKPAGWIYTRSGRTQNRGRISAWAIGPGLGLTFKLTKKLFLPLNGAVAWGEYTDSSYEGHLTKDAFFLRNDVGLRYLFSDQVSAFLAYKTQFASQRDAHGYFAHGPVIGLTVRFGLR